MPLSLTPFFSLLTNPRPSSLPKSPRREVLLIISTTLPHFCGAPHCRIGILNSLCLDLRASAYLPGLPLHHTTASCSGYLTFWYYLTTPLPDQSRFVSSSSPCVSDRSDSGLLNTVPWLVQVDFRPTWIYPLPTTTKVSSPNFPSAHLAPVVARPPPDKAAPVALAVSAHTPPRTCHSRRLPSLKPVRGDLGPFRSPGPHQRNRPDTVPVAIAVVAVVAVASPAALNTLTLLSE